MSDENQTVQAARQMMERTNPECPKCRSKGEWKYGDEDILNSYDQEKQVSYIKPMVQIWCAKCEEEMPHYVGEN